MISVDIIQINIVFFYKMFKVAEPVWAGIVHIILIIANEIIITDSKETSWDITQAVMICLEMRGNF